MIEFYDTHAHYDDGRFDSDRDQLLRQLRDEGVARINNIGTDVPSSEESIALAERYGFIYAAVGGWPGNVGDMTEHDLEIYRQMCSHEKVVAIGEIGLDYYHKNVSPEVQQHWFRRHLDLAAELNMPVVVHERDAHGDAMEIVREYADRVTGVFHCFSGSAEMAKELVRLGWYVSFTGVITFKNARKTIEAAAAIPLERIMIETDAPYLAPEPHRGRRNHSGYVPEVAKKIAEIKGISLEDAARITMENGNRFFRIPG